MWGDEGLARLLRGDYKFDTVLDVGSGAGEHAEAFRKAGHYVLELEPKLPAVNGGFRIPTRFEDFHPPEPQQSSVRWGCVWMCHVLEHQRNPGAFLDHVHDVLLPGGILAVTVPPLKHAIVGGHVLLWNAGLLLYHFVLAGIDCKWARVKTYGYNITVLVRVNGRMELPRLEHDFGDLEKLADFFPPGLARQEFCGDIAELNWEDG